MRRTRFGRQTYLLGENRVAARAAALPITLLTVGAFGIASLYTAGSGILIGATSANASLLLVGSYTYDAIAAALVGGNAVTGGRGSIARTAAGAIFIATISDMLLLRGYSTGAQILYGSSWWSSLTNLRSEPMSTTRRPRRPRAGEAAPFGILAIMSWPWAFVPA
jgi:ribose/xylose/arabinose/galactoside ABC-type transport system permease subunit